MMRGQRSIIAAASVAGALAMGACVTTTRNPRGDTAREEVSRGELAQTVVSEWSDYSRLAARTLMEKYGTPDEVHYGSLVWKGRPPWRRIMVRDVRPARIDSGGEELGLIEETVAAPLSPRQIADLASFDARVSYNPRAQELSAASDREELNYLRLNLAHDIVQGRLTAAQARGAYADIVSLEQSGKTSPYVQGLLWTPGP